MRFPAPPSLNFGRVGRALHVIDSGSKFMSHERHIAGNQENPVHNDEDFRNFFK